MPEISVLVEAGKASAGAPLGPALGPLGVNIGEVVNKINEKTKPYAGMKVPVKVVVDSATKGFEISVGSPPTSALIKKELNLEKAAANPKTEVKGNMSMEQVLKIARMKIENLASYKVKSAAKEIIGVCDSMGITVEGKKAREVQQAIDAGEYDSALAEGQEKKGEAEKEEKQVQQPDAQAQKQETGQEKQQPGQRGGEQQQPGLGKQSEGQPEVEVPKQETGQGSQREKQGKAAGQKREQK